MLALRVLGASLMLVCVAASAPAADFNPDYSNYARPLPIWSGIYLGVHGGYAGAHASGTSFDGFFGGGQAGFNAQIANNFIVGLEADVSGADVSRTDTGTVFGIAGSATTRTYALGTARGRVGVTFDRFMIYGTGGFAWAVNRLSATVGGLSVSDERAHVGYTFGAGLEWMVSPAWTVRAEYLYANFGSQDYFAGTVASGRISANLARFSVNYLFR